MIKSVISGDGEKTRHRFTLELTAPSGLKLYARPSDSAKLDTPLFVEIEDGLMVFARCYRRNFTGEVAARNLAEIPEFGEWKNAVCKIIQDFRESKLVIPWDSVCFGFTRDEIQATRDHHFAIKEQNRIEREEKETARRESEERKQVAYIDGLKQLVSDGESIDGESLVDLSRELGIEIHPRTCGMIKTRVVSIGIDTAKKRGKGSIQSAYEVYGQCQNALTGELVTA